VSCAEDVITCRERTGSWANLRIPMYWHKVLHQYLVPVHAVLKNSPRSECFYGMLRLCGKYGEARADVDLVQLRCTCTHLPLAASSDILLAYTGAALGTDTR
jgi:hypothetical protein